MYVYMCVSGCRCVQIIAGTLRGQKKPLGPLELGLQAAVSCQAWCLQEQKALLALRTAEHPSNPQDFICTFMMLLFLV